MRALSPDELRSFGNALEEIKNRQTWTNITQRESSFTRGPLLWLTKHTKTEDEHWLHKGTTPVCAFPPKSYFLILMSHMLSSSALFIPKSREMMTSWLACGYVAWMCTKFPQILWLLQTEKEDKVRGLVNYCRILHRYQDDWMKRKNPLIVDNELELKWANGSRVVGLPKGVNQVRMFHPHGYLMDEAAFLPEAEACYNAVKPVAKQIIAVSSDGMGWFHNECKLLG